MAERELPHYRVAFLDALRQWLQPHAVAFNFLHEAPDPVALARGDAATLPWAQQLPPARRPIGGKAVWQPFATQGQDLVIVSHENALLFNHWLSRPWRPFRLGWFGHGANLAAAHPNGWHERFKRFSARQADWWFAYTPLSQQLLGQAGVAPTHITVVNNATDTALLRRQIAATSAAQQRQLRQQHGLTPGHTALFLGSMYAGKGIDRLLTAATRVRRQDPAFVLLMVGDGPARSAAEATTHGQPHVRWLGRLHGADKAAVMAVSDCLCLPAAVGLALVDGLAAGLPLLSTDSRGHGPEIAYLNPGRNGILTAPEPEAYAAALLSLLQDPPRLQRWREQAAADGQRYSAQAMAARFGQGVLDALAVG